MYIRFRSTFIRSLSSSNAFLWSVRARFSFVDGLTIKHNRRGFIMRFVSTQLLVGSSLTGVGAVIVTFATIFRLQFPDAGYVFMTTQAIAYCVAAIVIGLVMIVHGIRRSSPARTARVVVCRGLCASVPMRVFMFCAGFSFGSSTLMTSMASTLKFYGTWRDVVLNVVTPVTLVVLGACILLAGYRFDMRRQAR